MIVVAVVISVGAKYSRDSWSKRFVIRNPQIAPLSMNNEGDGANGPFFPSSSQVAGKRKIPSKFFMESDACERCHQDIFKEWKVRPIISRRSTISGIARASSTCRT